MNILQAKNTTTAITEIERREKNVEDKKNKMSKIGKIRLISCLPKTLTNFFERREIKCVLFFLSSTFFPLLCASVIAVVIKKTLYVSATIVLLIISLFFVLCGSSLHANDFIDAQNYYEAKEYSQAESLYNKLLQSANTPWEHDVILYNLGTALLAKENLDKAVETFQSISLSKESSPLLIQRLKTNVAIARFKQAEFIVKDIKPDLPNVGDDYAKAIYLYRDSLHKLREADEAECQLQLLEGETVCKRVVGRKDLKLAAESKLADLLKAYTEYQQKNPLEAMKIGKTTSTRQLLQRIDQSYQALLAQQPPLASALTILSQDIDQMINVLLGESQNSADALKESSFYLNISIKYLNASGDALSRLNLEAAYQVIKRLVRPEEQSPKNILTGAIDDQKYALSITRIVQQLQEQNLAANILITEAQKDTLKVAFPYLKTVLELQQQKFKSEGCQKKPWDETMPLFDAGYRAAATAVSLLPQKKVEAIKQQEGALKYWEQALKKMEEKKSGDSKDQKEQDQQQSSRESLQRTLQLLQEMQNDDQIQKRATTPLKEVQRPW